MIDRDATKASFLDFFNDQDRSKSFVEKRWKDLDKKRFPLWWVIAASVLALTVVGIPPALVLLYVGFSGPRTAREKYLKRTDNLTVLTTYVVVANSEVADPAAMGAALVVGSFETPTPELESVCKKVTNRLQELFQFGQPETGEEELYAFVANDDAEPNRRRPIPAKYTDNHELYAFDVVVDRSVLNYHTTPREVVAIGASGAFGVIEPIPVECVVEA